MQISTRSVLVIALAGISTVEYISRYDARHRQDVRTAKAARGESLHDMAHHASTSEWLAPVPWEAVLDTFRIDHGQ
jgi:hypothetical protein